MRVAVVTAYYQEPLGILQRCVDSVRAQGHPCTHILVADGHARPELDEWPVQHVKLPVSHRDIGDTPRLIGCVSAYSQGFDALCWLDADNWLEPAHVALCVALAQEQGVSVVTSARMLRRPDGSALGVCTESDGETFNDTNCYFLTREAMGSSVVWVFKQSERIGDR